MTAEEKVKMTVGNLVVENIFLATKIEELTKKVAELEQPKDKLADSA